MWMPDFEECPLCGCRRAFFILTLLVIVLLSFMAVGCARVAPQSELRRITGN